MYSFFWDAFLHVVCQDAGADGEGDEADGAGAGVGDGASGDGAASRMSGDVTEHEAEILAQLTPEQVQSIMQSVFDEMLSGVQVSEAVL